jgi:hypothetical protein
MIEPVELDTVTTEDLVTELQKRFNFRGVVIWQPKYNGVPNTEWRWHSMHCDCNTVCQEISQALSSAVIDVEEGGEPTAVTEDPAVG